MAKDATQKARECLEIVVGPEEIVAKVPELGFKKVDDLLKANGLSQIPPLPSDDKLKTAAEQKKALVFRTVKNGAGKDVTLALLKEVFGALIYSKWFIEDSEPFATEPVKSGWALVDLEPMPESAEMTYDEQIAFVKDKHVKLKTAAEDAYDLIVVFKATGKYFRGEPVNARTASTSAGEPVKISHFNKAGMAISKGWGKTVRSGEIGAATEII